MSVRYRMRRWYDHWLVLTYLKGSVLPRALCSILFSTVLCCVYWKFGIQGNHLSGGGILGNPQIYGYFMQVKFRTSCLCRRGQTAALILAFTTGISYNRFWEALAHLSMMTNALSQAASMMLAFDECASAPSAAEAPLRWRAVTLHYFSILHAVCCQKLFSVDGVDASLDILGGLTEDEKQELSSVSDQASLVFHWLNKRISTRVMTGGLHIPPPISSQLWTQLSSAMTAYFNALKILDTPLPLPYQQSLAWSDVTVILLTPFCICSYVKSLYVAALFTFCTSMLFHGIYLADVTMQQPFGNKSNDLPLVDRHRDFIDRLISFVTLELANELNRLYEHVDSLCRFIPTQQQALPKTISFRAVEVIPRRHSEDTHKKRRRQESSELQSNLELLAHPLACSGSVERVSTSDTQEAPKDVAVRKAELGFEPSPNKQLLTYRSTISLNDNNLTAVHSPIGLTRECHSAQMAGVGALFVGGKILAKEYIMPASRSSKEGESCKQSRWSQHQRQCSLKSVMQEKSCNCEDMMLNPTVGEFVQIQSLDFPKRSMKVTSQMQSPPRDAMCNFSRSVVRAATIDQKCFSPAFKWP